MTASETDQLLLVKVGVVHDVASELVRIDHVQLLLLSRRDDLRDAW